MGRLSSALGPAKVAVGGRAAVQARRRPWAGAVLAAYVALLTGVVDTAAAVGDEAHPAYEFYFTRGIYTSISDDDAWGARWAIDYPEADQHFLVALGRLTGVDAFPDDHAVALGDATLRDYPFVYVVEAGALAMNAADRQALREYLLAGGFLVVDDFWGTWAWDNLSAELAALFPERTPREVPLSHPLFTAFYDIRALLQVPNVALAGSGRTHEYDGTVPHVRGIFDDDERLMVLINWNTDLGDAWEWADSPEYPLRFSNYAFELGVNIVIYALSY